MSYLLYSCILISLSFLIYKVLLAKETFYHLNRWILLGCIPLSFLLPLITVPANISFRAAIAPQTIIQETVIHTSPTTNLPPTTISNNELPSTTDIQPPATIIAMDWKSIVTYIYILGVMAFGVNFLIQLGVLLFRMLKLPTIAVDAYKIVETNTNHAPYSFWNRIFINPNQYDPDTYYQIIKHEQIHIAGAHSLDMIIVELLVSLQWFNPFAWLYRKAIDNNLEYLTDNSMLSTGEDKEAYQMNLLKVSTPNMPTGLATSYNQSFLKKRILMMNSKKSTAKSGWKYLIIIPLLAVTVLSFNPVTTPSPIANIEDLNTKNTSTELQTSNNKTTAALDYTRGVWDAEIGENKLCVMYRSAEPLKGNFWSTTRCYETTYFTNFPNGDRQKLEIIKDAGTMTYIGQFENGIGDGRYTFIPNTDFITAVEKEGLEIDNRDLVHCFLTDFDSEYLSYLKAEKLGLNQNNFEAIIRKSLPLEQLKMYRKELDRLSYTDYTIQQVAKLNLFKVDTEYISFINTINNNKTALEKITKAKIHQLTPAFIESYTKQGYKSMSLDDYMKLKIHNVSPEFIATFKKQGYTDITAKQAQNLKIHNVTPAFVQSFKDLGYKDITLKEAQNLKIHNVTAALVKSYKTAGQSAITLKEAIKLKIHNITPTQAKIANKHRAKSQNKSQSKSQNKSNNKSYHKSYNKSNSTHHSDHQNYGGSSSPNEYIKEFRALGYNDITVDDIIKLKVHNVTPDYVKRFNEVGFKNIPLRNVIALKIHNVTPEYIHTLKKAGYNDIPLKKATSLKIHNVSTEDAVAYKKMGYKSITIKDLISFRIHNVTPEYLRKFKKTKFGTLPLDEIVSFKIHNVTPEFIQSFEAMGYTNITAKQARNLKIHNVKPAFVKSLKEQDSDITLEEAIRIKIHF